jgi:predicted negative regulator of RcsB-dependent stress response
MARILDGDMHFPRGEYDQALSSYDKAAQESPEALKPFALSDKILTLEAAGKADQCVSAAQSFLDTTPDHLLAPLVHACLARCQLAEGQADAAKATLQKITIQYPNTPWDEWAKGRLASAK